MKLIKAALVIGSVLLSSMVWAEGGGDRAFARFAAHQDQGKSMAQQAVKIQPAPTLKETMVTCQK
ncbi:co-regulatory protein PtrA N-terminal domain-containing protein [Pseudomonas umsongensis]|uniref:co-regulatory protein PtrA N-terminal domain-containing protein n=1 Tax=Pseudomonas umsongensis TaxID=198618 RepID=UPI000371147C|nr:co-regulatory protein PtrA N-terminal domain-containing protein [Pseudomonas umsongensis]